MPNSRTHTLLGYADDARLLIINADDIGMCHSVNDAIIHAFRRGIVRSTSLMMPCPWASHAIKLLKENPDLPFGVHLTVISEQPIYRWGAISCREDVPSLLDEEGYFYSEARRPEFLERAKLNELEIEFRAQIERVLAIGLKPTHLDWHCLRNGGNAANFDLTLKLAKEYGLAVRVYDPDYSTRLQSQGMPTNDYPLLDSYDLDLTNKSEAYAQLLRDLPVGLSEWAVHPGTGDAEMQAVEPDAWQVRQSDFDFVTSPEAKQIIEEEGIVLLDYGEIQKVWTS